MPKCRVCGCEIEQEAIDTVMANSTEGPASWGLTEEDVYWYHAECAEGEGEGPIPEGWEIYWIGR